MNLNANIYIDFLYYDHFRMHVFECEWSERLIFLNELAPATPCSYLNGYDVFRFLNNMLAVSFSRIRFRET